MAKHKQKSTVPQAKITIEISDSELGFLHAFTANSKQEAEAMIFAFNQAFDICGNSCLSAKISS